jgi:hypothetical protein
MLLLDDDDELPQSPEPGEVQLTARLGLDGLQAIDAALASHARPTWLKVARIVHEALDDGHFAIDDDAVNLHVRRVASLVASGKLESQGNLRRPRWCEVRRPGP